MEEACNALSSLPAYRSAVASVINRVARAYAGADIPRAVNRAYLQFFLPFWWEHILERGRLDEPAAEKQVTLIGWLILSHARLRRQRPPRRSPPHSPRRRLPKLLPASVVPNAKGYLRVRRQPPGTAGL